MFRLVVATLVLVSSTLTQGEGQNQTENPDVCMPEQFEGIMRELDTLDTTIFYMDFRSQRLLMTDSDSSNLIFVNLSTGDHYLKENGTCQHIKTISSYMIDRCVPAKTKASDVYFGSKANPFNTQTFVYQKGDFVFFTSLNTETRLPVLSGLFYENKSHDVKLYYDITNGISNPSVFKVTLDDCVTSQ